MKTSLGLRLGQSLTMTPALQQAIKLLQLSSLDLQQEIQQVLESNVMLELESDAAPEAETAEEARDAREAAETPAAAEVATVDVSSEVDIPTEMPVDAEWGDVYDGAGTGSNTKSGSDDDELQDYLQANLHGHPSLREHLLWQAGLAPFTPTEEEIAAHLIDAINDDGYLENWAELLPRLQEVLGVDADQVDTVLKTVQEFDPNGVGARDLAECLRLQLLQFPAREPGIQAALVLVDRHINLLARKDEALIVRTTGLKVEDIRAALALVQTLQPHPGRPFQAHESDYIAPDVHVTKKEGRWKVSLNPEHVPKLRINGFYQSMIRRADSSRDQLTLKSHLQEARYFINSLEARNETLLRVAQCIVEEQRAFLEYGEEAMRPLVLRDIAEQLGIHESTVSRATANKYMLTPRGLYELKFFFSSHVQTTQGGVCSATAIQAMIKRLIAGEDPARPLSDSTLSELLLKEGIQVARRTVAKYREGLGIPPSHERKPPS
ncbi:MAG TPA: RNA polymerase factor sigma-54 [Solimonas sp.]|nr:RNA polymerase factor sigma-54 [Solimonas sp.]